MTNPLLFLLAATMLVVIPGPNHLYITARSIAEGRRAGIASALGVETGTLVHMVAAAAGLSAVIAASSTAFAIVRYAGAAYLVYMAIRTFRSRGAQNAPDLPPQPLGRIYLDGVLVNILNPKVILFFLAFLPQFVDREAGAVPAQILVMGFITGLIGVVSDMTYAVAADSLAGWLRGKPAFQRRQRFATGFIYLGLGAVAIFAGPGHRRA